MLGITPSQTIGPFPHEGWRWAFATSSAADEVVITGRVLGGDDQPLNDAILEAYSSLLETVDQRQPAFVRVPTNAQGSFRLALPQPQPGEPAALIAVFARGLLKHHFTAVMLNDDEEVHRSHLLQQVPAERRETLLAHRRETKLYHWDIRLQGPHETVFLDFE